MGVTIVSDELSVEEVQALQKRAELLEERHNYSVHAIMHNLGTKEHLSVSLITEDGQLKLKCQKN